MALGRLQGFHSGSSSAHLRTSVRRTPAGPSTVRPSQGTRIRCSLGNFYSPAQRRNLHRGNIPDPIDEEWKVVRRRADSLDAGVPSTSGRAAASSSSSRAPLASGSSASTGASSSSKSRQVDSYNLEDSWDLTDDAMGGYTPFPPNLPTNEGGLSGAGMEFWHMSSGVHLSDSKEVWGKLGQVFVLLFGVGEAETEGIYSLRAMSREEGLPQDTIVAFEDLEDAERYCTLLQATMPHVPNVMPIEPKELLEFCCDAGYNCRLEPRGSWFTPPDYNVGMTDWERSLRLREGQWSVLERDPERIPSDPPPAAQPPAPFGEHPSPLQHLQPPPFGHMRPGQRYTNNAGAYSSMDYELEELKARLERLLPDA